VAELVLRVESRGQLLGEFPLQKQQLVLQLRDALTGQAVSTLTIEPALEEPLQASPEAQPEQGGGLFQDETVDLRLSNDDTLARGLMRIREAARAAPSTVNVQLPIAPHDEPDVLEAVEESLPLPTGQGGASFGAAAADDAHRAEARLDALPPRAESAPSPPSRDEDRSITRALSHGLEDFRHLMPPPVQDELEESQSTQTQPIESEEHARPTFIEAQEEPQEHDEGPPTRISNETLVPLPIAPGPDPERRAEMAVEETLSLGSVEDAYPPSRSDPRPVRPLDVATDFADDDDDAPTVVGQDPSALVGQPQPVAPSAPDLSQRSRPEDPGLVGMSGAYDEMPVPEQRAGREDDDLSLSMPYQPGLTDASIDDLSLPVPGSEHTASVDASLSLSLPLPASGLFEAESDDDITLPLPEASSFSGEHEELGSPVPEPTVTSHIAPFSVEPLGVPQVVRPRLMDTTAGFARDPSTERLEGAEVWFRRQGEWTPRGALALGQHVQAFGGMVRCDDTGGLVVLAGPRLHGSATMPSGELRQIDAGQQAVRLPAGTSVILWHGEQGIYVRSNMARDAGADSSDPAAQERSQRSRSWSPPGSD
jgi:hypothetical protein